MTDRISGPNPAVPLPKARPLANAGPAAARPAGDALALGARAAMPVNALLPVAPAISSGFQDVRDWVSHGFHTLGSKLSSLWHGFTGALHRLAPYGLGVKLHVLDKHQYPSALSRYWLNVKDAKDPLPVSTAELEREVQAELARGGGTQAAPLAWKGNQLDPASVKGFARAVGSDLADVGKAVWITQRVLASAQAVRQDLHARSTDPTLRAHADQALELMAQASRDAFVSRVKAYARLTEPERQRVEALRLKFEGSPRVQEAIDGLVESGRMQGKDLRDGKTTLEQLEALATAPLAPGIARLETLGETLMEIAQPGSISQRGRNTCGAACAQGTLAVESPAEYVRLVVGLASPEGQVQTTTGEALKRNAQWALDEHEGDRTVPSRLLQSSFMQISSNGSYDNALDRGRWPGLFDWVGNQLHLLDGSFPAGEARLLHAITGRSFYAEWNGAFEAKGEGFEQASREHPVMALVNFNDKDGGESLHWVRVIGYDKEKDEYRCLNARARDQSTDAGTEDVVGGKDFRKHHVAVVHEGSAPVVMV